MHIDIEPKYTEQIKPAAVPQQTAFWAKVKENLGYETRAFDIKIPQSELSVDNSPSNQLKHVTDDLLVVMQQVGADHQVAYIPYGPLVNPDEDIRGLYLEELSESIRPFLPSNTILIRYDLIWESPWADDENRFNDRDDWLGPPEPHYQEMRVNFNTHNWNLRKAPSDLLPSHTIFLDLNHNQDTLLQRMKPKTRYNIRLSKRKGVEVKEVSFDNLPVWYDLYRQTAIRNGIVLDDISYFRTVLETQASDTNSPADVHMLLAESDGVPLAGMFLVITGKRATYLYGASSSHNRNMMATYALQWEAIKIARQKGCTEYDMFGVAPTPEPSHPMHGLYRFKTGFGGDLYHRMGCWDYPLNEEQYKLFMMAERNAQGYHIR
ncbi:lipid II:glycine glycyltransferase FemX [Prolixibacter denitrificans]|uniref:Lipid II:glycine glycyltransferase (Peptidoglycan interpeptide bridge formation enzyme) n=1 Tax=Prolixibacter denitrificans TaxID=1541063 RepID=A0A2P8C6R2_9BACT|nr:peptidoglycan bridge formation glycyltransferase FemA/FemB family protein [Prolixibacter denitrificans]PSK80645.1 lipid II:glycine glycyltransferase (peptidoglycan interpeptide bridge formation enzyme) [Prolixibacter denitrificans]GET22060.1 peptidoglycan bridge formation protein FemAB [Prolixibacter denitrificans]